MIDRWLVVSVHGAAPDEEGLVAALLLEAGGRAVEEREDALVTHLPSGADPDAVVACIRAGLEGLGRGARPERAHARWSVRWTWQPHEDWAETWKKGLVPRRIGRRIVVSPTWERPSLGPDDLAIHIDPGVAFGTAEHGSTRGCLQLLERWVDGGDRVLDVGAGTGILAIAAALLGADPVVAIEADPYACEAARDNLAVNRVEGAVEVVEGRADATELAESDGFDGIVANIETRVLLSLSPGFEAALGPDGWLIVGGVPRGERIDVVSPFEERGLHLRDEVLDEDWWSGAFICGRRAAP